jgi:hypothetical protein
VPQESNTVYALAWRLTPPENPPRLQISTRPGGYLLIGQRLVPGQPYIVQSATKMPKWTTLTSFTASSATELLFNAPFGGTAKRYFRLQW